MWFKCGECGETVLCLGFVGLSVLCFVYKIACFSLISRFYIGYGHILHNIAFCGLKSLFFCACQVSSEV